MENIYEIKIERCYDAKFARSSALRRCVFDTPSLSREFYNAFDVERISGDEFSTKVKDFIRNRGLRILDEKPVVRIVDGRYRVDVYFKITW